MHNEEYDITQLIKKIDNVGKKNYTLFILALFPEIITHSNTSIENTDTIHNILTRHTNTIHYSCWCQFLPTKVR